MKEGKVKWYDETRGFGFIETENSDDVFVHRTNLISPYAGLNQGDAVSFEITEGDRGLVASKVRNI